MTASSNERTIILARLETKQVQRLLSTLSRSALRRKQFVEAAYSEQARGFQETVQFLKDIGWIRERRDELALTYDGETAGNAGQNDAEIRRCLAEAMVAEASPYRVLLADYLVQFKMDGFNLVYRPPISERLQESPLRNFLMDIRVVTYQAADDVYVLEEDGVELYVWANNLKRPTSRSKLQADAKQKEELGSAAELAVLDYEKNRVGGQWISKVEHVSARIPFACYDIKSVTLQNSKAVPRYIEVKAVSADSHQFYWTASEFEAARLLRTKYFLYLLPVVAGDGFDLTRMLIVEDPCISIYQNPQMWLIEENVIVCTRRQRP